MIEDKSHLTAIGRKGPSVPARKAAAYMDRNATVLDWGCGRGADVKFFRHQGLISSGYDPVYARGDMTEWCYDYITCSYVLNVLKPEDRGPCLDRLVGYSIPGQTVVFITVRGERELKKQVKESWYRAADGWITAKGTFQHGFYAHELQELLEAHGLEVIKSLIHNAGTIMLMARVRSCA